MSAITRWVEYDISTGGAYTTGGATTLGRGTRGRAIARGKSNTDKFTITATTNRLYVNIDGEEGYIALTQGVNLDPRFIARDITEKLHNMSKNLVGYDFASCVWDHNRFVLYSGSLGSGSSVAILDGANTAHFELGFGDKLEIGGSNNNTSTGNPNIFDGGIVVSGTYGGFIDEIYKIVINKDYNIMTPVKGGSNNYNGLISIAGVFNHPSNITYSLYIDTTNGSTVGGGTGNVPKLTWESTGNVDNSTGPIEILYPDYWYDIGSKGLRVKLSDAVFSHCVTGTPAWTIQCIAPQYASGSNTQSPVGIAQYIWSSNRGDNCTVAVTTSGTTPTPLGSRGLTVLFQGSTNFSAGDEFYVVCKGPQPKAYDISNLNYGNTTVSTESAVRCVVFEIISGAVDMSTVRFCLADSGSFQHHRKNNEDTKFRFGTVGPDKTAGVAPINGIEWRTPILASDIASNTPPTFLSTTRENLQVVSDADQAQTIGCSNDRGLLSDPILLNIRLGVSEVGANSGILYRAYFDYN